MCTAILLFSHSSLHTEGLSQRVPSSAHCACTYKSSHMLLPTIDSPRSFDRGSQPVLLLVLINAAQVCSCQRASTAVNVEAHNLHRTVSLMCTRASYSVSGSTVCVRVPTWSLSSLATHDL
eukprot:1944089-Rhodomonas_salina.1